jgi:hypothetical protein
MATFLAIYRGDTIASAQLIAVSTDPSIVTHVASRLLATEEDEPEDPVLLSITRGRTNALRLVARPPDADG